MWVCCERCCGMHHIEETVADLSTIMTVSFCISILLRAIKLGSPRRVVELCFNRALSRYLRNTETAHHWIKSIRPSQSERSALWHLTFGKSDNFISNRDRFRSTFMTRGREGWKLRWGGKDKRGKREKEKRDGLWKRAFEERETRSLNEWMEYWLSEVNTTHL